MFLNENCTITIRKNLSGMGKQLLGLLLLNSLHNLGYNISETVLLICVSYVYKT